MCGSVLNRVQVEVAPEPWIATSDPIVVKIHALLRTSLDCCIQKGLLPERMVGKGGYGRAYTLFGFEIGEQLIRLDDKYKIIVKEGMCDDERCPDMITGVKVQRVLQVSFLVLC